MTTYTYFLHDYLHDSIFIGLLVAMWLRGYVATWLPSYMALTRDYMALTRDYMALTRDYYGYTTCDCLLT